MEISFVDVPAAEAGMLVRDLRLALRREGVPPSALEVRRSSPENMDLGTLLSIDVEAIIQVLGAVGSLASFGRCIYDTVGKSNVSIQIRVGDRVAEIDPGQNDIRDVEDLLRRLSKPREPDV